MPGCKFGDLHKLLEGVMMRCLSLRCLSDSTWNGIFVFAICAEGSSAEARSGVLSNSTSIDDTRTSGFFNCDLVCSRTFRTMPDWLYIAFVFDGEV